MSEISVGDTVVVVGNALKEDDRWIYCKGVVLQIVGDIATIDTKQFVCSANIKLNTIKVPIENLQLI